MGVNSLGTVADAYYQGGLGNGSRAWDAQGEVVVHVGADFWSMEFRLDFGQEGAPRPGPGALWGFDFVRVFRGAESSQWVRTYSAGHSPDDFGLLVFD